MRIEPKTILPHLATMTAFAVMVTVVVDSYSAINDFQQSENAPLVLNTEPQKQAKVALVKKINPRKLAGLHVFGKPAQKKLAKVDHPKQTAPQVLPKSTVKLGIKGLFSNTNADKGIAVISNKGVDKPFRVGQEIDKNIKLHAVYTDYIIIANNDRLERLDLQELSIGKQNPNRFKNIAKRTKDVDEFKGRAAPPRRM